MKILKVRLRTVLILLACISPVPDSVSAGCLVPLVESELAAFTIGAEKVLTTTSALEIMRISSRARLEELRIALAPFTDDERRVMEKAALLKPFPVTRAKFKNLRSILKAGAIVSPEEAVRRGIVAEAPYTPDLENELFGAYDCVFASLGPKAGREQYGEIIIRLKNAPLAARAWGSFSSGFYFIKKSHVANDVVSYKPQFHDRLAYLHTVFSAQDWGELYPLMITAYLRSKPDADRLAAQKELLAADDAEKFYDIIEARKGGYLEIKVDAGIPLEDVEGIEVPAKGLQEVLSWPEAAPYRDIIKAR